MDESTPNDSTFFNFLEGELRLVIVNSNLKNLIKLKEMLDRLGFYSIRFVNDFDHAEEILIKKEPVHACICDHHDPWIGIRRIAALKGLRNKLPVLFLTESSSIEAGYRLAGLGVESVVAKPLTVEKCKNIVCKTNSLFLDSLLKPSGVYTEDMNFRAWFSTLKQGDFSSVSEWANAARVDASYLRRRCKFWFNVGPKTILKTYNLFMYALKCRENELFGMQKGIPRRDEKKVLKLKKHYTNNKDTVRRLLYRLG